MAGLRKYYHSNNLNLTPYAPWRVRLIAIFSGLLGVQVHVMGVPFGAAYRRGLWIGERAQQDSNA